MIEIPMKNVALAVENEFAFLEDLAAPLVEWADVFPESSNGGFKLTFQTSSGGKVKIAYTDREFSVLAGRRVLFGASKLGSFASSVFSCEQLISALPTIRRELEASLRLFAKGAT